MNESEMQARINMLETQLRIVLANAPVAMFALDGQGVYTFCEGQVLADLGLTPEQLIGQSVFDLFGDIPGTVDSVQRALAGETVTTTITLGPNTFQNINIPYNGGVIGLTINITRWQRAEEEARRQREFLRKVIDTLPVRVFWKDTDLRYLGCNQVFAEDAGLASPDDVVGKTDYDMPWVEQSEKYRADDRAVMQSGEMRIGFEEQQSRPDGSVGWVRTSKLPLYDADGAVTGVLGVYEDITERKIAQEERLRLQEQVIEAQRQALADLSTPIIPVMDGIIVMPLVGSVDTARARDIMRALLRGISQYRARIAILDITGVPLVDSGVADHLNHTIQAARLKGTHTIVTGISDAVAEAIVDLGIDWSRVETLANLQSGLVAALDRLGMHLSAAGHAVNGG